MLLDPKLETQGPNRLIIYAFYDKQGKAASFVPYMLEHLRPFAKELVIVVNGKLDIDVRSVFDKVADKVMIRENLGLDIAGYQHAMKTLGWDHLPQFDEVLLTNDTILGPVYPFSEMFEDMDARDVDFWGMTAYAEDRPFEGDVIPTHLQSFWHAYRKSLVTSMAFQEYWDKLPVYDDYAKATHEHEIPFTQRFADLGFTWDSYTDYQRFADQASYQMLYMPMQLVRDGRCPVFKRRSFFLDPFFAFNETGGQAALELYEYVRDHTEYDENIIWDALLPAYNIYDIARAMHLDYILPTQALNPQKAGKSLSSTFICHIYFLDMLDETLGYLANLPLGTDLYITTPEGKAEDLERAIAAHGFSHPFTVIPVKNRGRDVSALLVGAKDIVLNGGYDVIGFAHDKKSSQNAETGHHGTETAGFTYKLFENTLGSAAYVKNILTLFADNPRMGLACPPPPFHALYFAHTLPHDWAINFDNTKELLEDKLHLHVPLDEKKPTRSAIGSCYWFRVDALRPLFEYGWSYEDFLPEGEMGGDGSISHAIERANGYIVQSQGYYPAWIMSDHYARIDYDSLMHATTLLLNNLGNTMRGESVAQVAGELHASLGFFRSMKRGLHRCIAGLFYSVTGSMSDESREALRKAIWKPLNVILRRNR